MLFRTWIGKTHYGMYGFNGAQDSKYYCSYLNRSERTALRGRGTFSIMLSIKFKENRI